MPYALLADLVVLLHFAFIAFVLVGALASWRWPWLAWVHLPCLAWGAFAIVTGTVCPLTPLEVHLRIAAGQAPYHGSFIARYLEPVIYPPGLTRPHQVGIGLALVLFNAIVYWQWWRRRQRTRALRSG